MTVPAPASTFTITDATAGSIYTVGVAAANVLGTGSLLSVASIS